MGIEPQGDSRVKQQSIGGGKSLALDEQTFQQLLESAYVLQKHNDISSNEAVTADDALAAVVETQKQIQTRKLDLPDASEFIAQRIRAITNAAGTAAGIVEGSDLVYLAATGNASRECGSRLTIESSVSAPVFLSNSPLRGKILEYADVNASSEGSAGPCRLRDIRALIVVPVHYEGEIAAVLEVRFDRPNAFHDQDVRTAELMASLLREAIARAAELDWKRSHAATRASAKPPVEAVPLAAPVVSDSAQAKTKAVAPSYSDELFGSESQEPIFSSERHSLAPTPPDQQAHFAVPSFEPVGEPPRVNQQQDFDAEKPSNPEVRQQDALTAAAPAPWVSASTTQQWLKTIRPRSSKFVWLSSQWRARRANFYLVVSGLLLLFVMTGWGTRSSHEGLVANSVTTARTGPPKPELTFFEKTLVAVGLADPPPAPVYLGNPNTQVWIDLHTALYYCPADSLYGKTPGGKFSLQRDAQLDQFEPANRKVCD